MSTQEETLNANEVEDAVVEEVDADTNNDNNNNNNNNYDLTEALDQEDAVPEFENHNTNDDDDYNDYNDNTEKTVNDAEAEYSSPINHSARTRGSNSEGAEQQTQQTQKQLSDNAKRVSNTTNTNTNANNNNNNNDNSGMLTKWDSKNKAPYKKSGADIIREAEFNSNIIGNFGFSTGEHLNAHYQTIAEENYIFRNVKCRANPNYHGPIFIPEDINVNCNCCGGLIDPVNRVPIPNFLHHRPFAAVYNNNNNNNKENKPSGELYFHLHCLCCFLCGKKASEHVAEVFVGIENQAVCRDCCFLKHHNHAVRKEEAEDRGIVLGAVPNPKALLKAFQRDESYRRCEASPYLLNHSADVPTVEGHGSQGSAKHHASTIHGRRVLPPPPTVSPSLYINSQLHNTKNTSKRSFELLQRQQYYTQNDNNQLVLRKNGPPAPTTNAESNCYGYILSGETPRLRPAAAAYLRDSARRDRTATSAHDNNMGSANSNINVSRMMNASAAAATLHQRDVPRIQE